MSNQLVTKADYISALTEDKGQFLPDGLMPAGGPKTSLATEKLVGNVKSSVDLSKTFTNDFAIQANKTEGFKTTTTPADRTAEPAPPIVVCRHEPGAPSVINQLRSVPEVEWYSGFRESAHRMRNRGAVREGSAHVPAA